MDTIGKVMGLSPEAVLYIAEQAAIRKKLIGGLIVEFDGIIPQEFIEHKYKGRHPSASNTSDFCIEQLDGIIEKLYEPISDRERVRILFYIFLLHNDCNKIEICSHWRYGDVFLPISKRHENGEAMYPLLYNWKESFLADLIQHIKFIKPQSQMTDEERSLMIFIKPIRDILRINWRCNGSSRTPIEWEILLGSHFEYILNLTSASQIVLFEIWEPKYARSFKNAMIQHCNNRKIWFVENPNASWMRSFVFEFMHNL